MILILGVFVLVVYSSWIFYSFPAEFFKLGPISALIAMAGFTPLAVGFLMVEERTGYAIQESNQTSDQSKDAQKDIKINMKLNTSMFKLLILLDISFAAFSVISLVYNKNVKELNEVEALLSRGSSSEGSTTLMLIGMAYALLVIGGLIISWIGLWMQWKFAKFVFAIITITNPIISLFMSDSVVSYSSQSVEMLGSYSLIFSGALILFSFAHTSEPETKSSIHSGDNGAEEAV